jgi:acyl carrier protein phosphodiesterase
MNYLAHQFLSGNNEGLRIGNFVGDMVKGHKWQTYPTAIQHGILLHRSIDDFTDHNQTVKEAVSLLKPDLGRYSAIALDIFFDHFLAKQWNEFMNNSLDLFAQETYSIMNKNIAQMPPETAYMLKFMETQNWLYNYQFIAGIEKTMNGMSRRANQPLFENSHLVLVKNYEPLKICFDSFFPQLQTHVKTFISNIVLTSNV